MFDITSFGARGDGQTNNTRFIQKAIDAAAGAGGGVVWVPGGRFLTGVLELKSGVELRLADNAVLLGSTRRMDYGGKVAAALFIAKGQHNISITGKGIIDGQGREVVEDVFRLLRADSLQDPEWQHENPWHQKRPTESNRPGLIDFSRCDSVRIAGVELKDAACWVQTYRECTHLTLENMRVESTAYWNNDGIDVVDCGEVNITGCRVNAADDGICLKSSNAQRRCENVVIQHCTVRSSASGIKFGTASRGGFRHVLVKDIYLYDTYRSAIALESVDGGILEDVNVEDVYAVNTGNAIFVRLGHRAVNAPVGQVKQVKISNVLVVVPAGKPDLGYEMEGPLIYTPHNIYPASITGLPGHPVEDITLENVEIVYRGEAHKDTAWFGKDSLEKVPEKESDYPEFSMFGEMPAWGLYVRHANGVTLKNVSLRVKKDFRPGAIFDDVKGLKMQDLHVSGGSIIKVR
jgi:polygalacturonase